MYTQKIITILKGKETALIFLSGGKSYKICESTMTLILWNLKALNIVGEIEWDHNL